MHLLFRINDLMTMNEEEVVLYEKSSWLFWAWDILAGALHETFHVFLVFSRRLSVAGLHILTPLKQETQELK